MLYVSVIFGHVILNIRQLMYLGVYLIVAYQML